MTFPSDLFVAADEIAVIGVERERRRKKREEEFPHVVVIYVRARGGLRKERVSVFF